MQALAKKHSIEKQVQVRFRGTPVWTEACLIVLPESNPATTSFSVLEMSLEKKWRHRNNHIWTSSFLSAILRAYEFASSHY